MAIMHNEWNKAQLTNLFRSRLAFDQTRGIDRLSPRQLARRLSEQCEIIERRMGRADYRFAPYVQVLKTKTAGQPPREICIPTARDRLVLLTLKERLHATFPSNVPRLLPNGMVRRALKALQAADPAVHDCVRLDIMNFYGSIRHADLMAKIASAMPPEETILVKRAVRNPAVPMGTRRSPSQLRRRDQGVPQGLSVSNVLADIALDGIDSTLAARCTHYFRFVDDIFLLVPKGQTQQTYVETVAAFASRGLSVHPIHPRSSKGGVYSLTERIEFLGYVFDNGIISVRPNSTDRFLDNIAARVTRFEQERRRRKVTAQVAADALIQEINERITGAISQSRRYGWLFYFAAMTDERLLFEMDAAVEAILRRLPEFRGGRPPRLKRLSRALYEIRHRADGPYMHSYDRYVTIQDKHRFLVERGQIAANKQMAPPQVQRLFGRYRYMQLSKLDKDLSFVS